MAGGRRLDREARGGGDPHERKGKPGWIVGQVWREGGLLAASVRTACRAYIWAPNEWTKRLILGLGAGMLAHQVFGLTDAFLLGTKPGVVMWMLMGLITGLYLKLTPDHHLPAPGIVLTRRWSHVEVAVQEVAQAGAEAAVAHPIGILHQPLHIESLPRLV